MKSGQRPQQGRSADQPSSHRFGELRTEARELVVQEGDAVVLGTGCASTAREHIHRAQVSAFELPAVTT
jgi:hypothetical protein